MSSRAASIPAFHPSNAQRARLRARVGQFVRQRRLALGLKLKDITAPLGYKSLNAVTNVESGLEGIPAKRAYAWAELLEVPRDAFYQFVTGQIDNLSAAASSVSDKQLTRAEHALLARYRRLPRKAQQLLQERAVELETLARVQASRRLDAPRAARTRATR